MSASAGKNVPIRYFAYLVLHLAVALAALSLLANGAFGENWFGDPIITPTNQSIRVVQIHDMNSDGVADLVGCSISPSAIVIWLGDPSGRMSFSQNIPGPVYGSFIVVDENTDGYPDLIAGDPFEIWDNDGSGHFAQTSRTIGGSMGDTADLNNDDLPDVVTKTSVDSVTIYLGTPERLSTSGQTIPMIVDGEPSASFSMRDLALGDIDGDQNADILLAGAKYTDVTYYAQLRWRLGAGDGTLGPIQSFAIAEWYELSGMEMADLDLDGDQDIGVMMVGFEWGHTSFFRYDPADATWRFLGHAPTTGLPHMARMDADLRPDLLLCDYPNIVRICRGNGPGSYQTVQIVAGGDGGIGRMTGGYGPDLIVATSTSPSEIHVRPNVVVTADVKELIGRDIGMRVWPSVGRSPLWIQWDRGVAGPNARVEVIAVDGRTVRRLQGSNYEARWGLDSEEGSRIGSGVFWIRLVGDGGAVASRRVTILR